jgi:hypothetical protein
MSSAKSTPAPAPKVNAWGLSEARSWHVERTADRAFARVLLLIPRGDEQVATETHLKLAPVVSEESAAQTDPHVTECGRFERPEGDARKPRILTALHEGERDVGRNQ